MLKGKSAIITGSTSGIGLGIAQVFAGQGCDLMINGFGDAAEIEKVRSDLEKTYGVKVVYSGADMSKPAEVAGMVEAAEAAFGKLDILVNNAGIQYTAPVEEFPVEKWDAIMAINLSAIFHAIRTALPGMKKRNFGRIINVASVHGLVASTHKAAYVAAKHGVLGLTKVVALETAEQNITCNAICPGWVLTPLVAKQIEDRAKANGQTFDQAKDELLSEKQPSKQFATPEQLGNLAAFLASDHGAQMTGVALPMDGGWVAR
ncbi:MAG TPA: 3-hydroxybutyrate dehydrogenase [Alphaproteobacteria bacterium]|nr:3-hydroxybutyrate dehydrogenase [Alphaproteobacteria bacterium]